MTGKGRGNNKGSGSRGREKARKQKRSVKDTTHQSFPPHSDFPITMPQPLPHGYTELPQHHQPYTFVQTSGVSSQGHRTVRSMYNPPASLPRGSYPAASHGSHRSMSQPYGSQPSVSQQSVSQSLVIRAAMSQSHGSHLSSSATPYIGGLRLRDSSFDPPTPSTHASYTHVSDDDVDDADDATAADEEVHYDQFGRIIIIPEGDGFLPSNIITRIITKATRKLYDAPYASWHEFPFSLKESKCVWEYQYSADVAANFNLKARKRLSHSFFVARQLNQKPRWLLQEYWDDLQRQWITAEFLQKSEKRKKARASDKGGSLHTGGSVSQGTIKSRMEKKLGRPMNQDEVFKETHIVKKKKETDEEKWVEGRASNVHDRFRVEAEEFIRSQPPNESGAPFQLSAEDIERLWTRAAGGPKWGKVYGLPTKTFHRYRCGMQGIGTSSQAEQLDGESLSAMRETVTKLTSELQASKKREKLRDVQYIGVVAQCHGMQEQIKNLLAASYSIPRSRPSLPEAGHHRARSSRPPRDRQVNPSQYRDNDISSSDGDDNDVPNNE